MKKFEFKFERNQINKISREKIIEELEKTAKVYNYKNFTQKEFDEIANISNWTVNREFGSWEKALIFLSDYLKKKNIDFKTIKRSLFTQDELFKEMERIWISLGHRPSRNEWVFSKPKISYDTYTRYFKSWQNACLEFIEYKMGREISLNRIIEVKNYSQNVENVNLKNHNKKDLDKKIQSNTRTISLKKRLMVLKRDNFRCVLCGKSPATDIGVKLNIDHIFPFSKGGDAELNNLQTLCEECNLGKGDSINILK